jgi:hypothetical protein
VTQVSYEAGTTEPTTAYLRAIQTSGIDIPAILFAHPSTELDSHAQQVDWQRLQQAFEDVEFFCQRFAPACPASYRWQMIRDLYQAPIALGGSGGDSSQSSPMALLSSIWDRFAKA